MLTAVTEIPAGLEPRPKVWTRAEVDALSSTGLFDQEKLELVEGKLIHKMGKLRPHVNAVLFLAQWLTTIFGLRFIN